MRNHQIVRNYNTLSEDKDELADLQQKMISAQTAFKQKLAQVVEIQKATLIYKGVAIAQTWDDYSFCFEPVGEDFYRTAEFWFKERILECFKKGKLVHSIQVPNGLETNEWKKTAKKWVAQELISVPYLGVNP